MGVVGEEYSLSLEILSVKRDWKDYHLIQMDGKKEEKENALYHLTTCLLSD